VLMTIPLIQITLFTSIYAPAAVQIYQIQITI
jgi:hypothetical protein